MTFPRVFLLGSLGLFAVIGMSATVKKIFFSSAPTSAVATALGVPAAAGTVTSKPFLATRIATPSVAKNPPSTLAIAPTALPLQKEGDIQPVDRIDQLFTTGAHKLPIVETITYTSNVPWLKGRPAWIGDYASHFSTSRHFIARSLNGKPDYFTQKISVGSKFNVLRKDKNFQFHLLVDVTRCKMAFYYIDLDTNERVLLKTYKLGLGRKAETASGTLTPLGKYQLGDKIAVYKPGIMGLFQDKQVEMIRIFGTRWIPFGKEIGACSAPAKGYGIHGAPWQLNKKTGKWTEERELTGGYTSDGCIRMNFEDIEELFSIIITKPTVVEIVKQFKDARLPGVEVTPPLRS